MKNTKIKPGQHKSISTEFKEGREPYNKGKKLKPLSKKIKKRIKAAINKHHIDLNRENNTLSNCLFLKLGEHKSLHAKAYNYLVEMDRIDEYIDWFRENYGLKEYTLKEYLTRLSRTRKYSETKLMKQNEFDSKKKPVKLVNTENGKLCFLFQSARDASIYLGLHYNTISTNINAGFNTRINGMIYKPSYLNKKEYLKLKKNYYRIDTLI